MILNIDFVVLCCCCLELKSVSVQKLEQWLKYAVDNVENGTKTFFSAIRRFTTRLELYLAIAYVSYAQNNWSKVVTVLKPVQCVAEPSMQMSALANFHKLYFLQSASFLQLKQPLDSVKIMQQAVHSMSTWTITARLSPFQLCWRYHTLVHLAEVHRLASEQFASIPVNLTPSSSHMATVRHLKHLLFQHHKFLSNQGRTYLCTVSLV